MSIFTVGCFVWGIGFILGFVGKPIKDVLTHDLCLPDAVARWLRQPIEELERVEQMGDNSFWGSCSQGRGQGMCWPAMYTMVALWTVFVVAVLV